MDILQETCLRVQISDEPQVISIHAFIYTLTLYINEN